MSAESFPDFQDFSPPTGDGFSDSIPTPGSREQFTNAKAEKVRAQSRAIRSSTQAIKLTRKQLKNYLLTKGMDLITSAVEFDRHRSFIKSSYIVYIKHENIMEPLASFLKRYPQFIPTAKDIESKLKNIGGGMNLKDAFTQIEVVE